MNKIVVSWAGGKDSSLAYYRAMLTGYEISYLLNFITQDAKTSMTHGLSSELLRSQAGAIGTPIIQRRTTWVSYEQELKNTINELKEEGIQDMVFGEIDLQEHKDWIERVCKEVNIKSMLPLWGDKPEKILNDLVKKGFKAIVVSVRDKIPGKEWLGRQINKEFIEKLYYLKEKFGFHPCGENGEYHTFVVDGPIFRDAIDILSVDKLLQQGQWFLKISKYRTRKKK